MFENKKISMHAHAIPLFFWVWRSHLYTVAVPLLLAVAVFTVYSVVIRSGAPQPILILSGLLLFCLILLSILRWHARVMALSISIPLQWMDTLLQHMGDNDYHQQVPAFPVIELQQTASHLIELGKQLSISKQCLLTTQREVEQARRDMLASSKLRAEFLALVSHEIRTPMNGILGMIDLLLDTSLTSKQREFAIAVQDSGRSLMRIIDDILDLSKIEAGKIELARMNFSPLELAEGAADVLAPRAHEKRLKLMTYIDPTIPAILSGDKGRLHQILLILLDNAIKFTKQGEVVLRVLLDRKTSRYTVLHFVVIDTGIGIPSSALSRLFQPFTQVDSSAARRYGGTGLGLSICKRLIEMMGGEIGVESQEGVGSKFWFKIPLSLVEDSIFTERKQLWDQLQVLIVEPGEKSRAVIRDYLRFWKAQVIAVADAQKALTVLKAPDYRNVDILLSGLSLEDNDSAHLLEVMAGDKKLNTIPRILLADIDDKDLKRQAITRGFTFCFTKPVHQAQLFNCLADIVHSSPVALEKDGPISARLFFSGDKQ
jgi:signal transduction histidine kinase